MKPCIKPNQAESDAPTCEEEVFNGCLWSDDGIQLRAKARNSVISTIDLPFRSANVMLICDWGACIHKFNLQIETGKNSVFFEFIFIMQRLCL